MNFPGIPGILRGLNKFHLALEEAIRKESKNNGGTMEVKVSRAVGELRVGLRTGEAPTAPATMAAWLSGRHSQGRLRET